MQTFFCQSCGRTLLKLATTATLEQVVTVRCVCGKKTRIMPAVVESAQVAGSTDRQSERA